MGAKSILKIGQRQQPAQEETIDIFGVAYKTLTVNSRNDLLVGVRANDFKKKYQSLNFNKLDLDNITEKDLVRIRNVVNDLVRIILPSLPDEVMAQLEGEDLDKIDIIQAYFNSANGKALLAEAQNPSRQDAARANRSTAPLAEFTPRQGQMPSRNRNRAKRRSA